MTSSNNITTKDQKNDSSQEYNYSNQMHALLFLLFHPTMSALRGKMLENASNADLVAEVLVEAATAKEPNLRYPVDKDVKKWYQRKRECLMKSFRT